MKIQNKEYAFGVDDMSRKKYVLKSKKRFYSFLIFTFAITFSLIYTASAFGYKQSQYKCVAVNSGDTLWSIAEDYGNNSNIRELIYNIKKVNNIDSSMLYARTAILIPIND